MSSRRAVTDVAPVETIAQQIDRLEMDRFGILRERARKVPGADARLDGVEAEIERLKKRPERDRAQADVLEQDHAAQRQREADAASDAKQAALVSAKASWARAATQVEQDMATGVIHLAAVQDVLDGAREVYVLTLDLHAREHRGARATPERFGEWLALRLGLDTPGPILHARRRMTLLQLLGLNEVTG